MEKADEQLLKEYLDGKNDVFGDIFQRYKHKVFNYALRIVVNRCDAEDITSEVFMRILNHKYHIQENVKFSTWVYKVTHNVCIDRLRKRNRLVSFFTKKKDSKGKQEWELKSLNDSPYQKAEKKDNAWHVKKAIFQLPLIQREVIALREYHQCSYDEISHVLGIPLGQVKINLFRARNFLKALLSSVIKEGEENVGT